MRAGSLEQCCQSRSMEALRREEKLSQIQGDVVTDETITTHSPY